MKYSFTRKVNMERFFPEMRFENADFTIEGCDSTKQAEKLVKEWIKSYVEGVREEKAKLLEKKAKEANPTIPPEANLSQEPKSDDDEPPF